MKREGRHNAAARQHAVSSDPPCPAAHVASPAKCHRPRCSLCRRHPASKSRDKTKGARKLRSCDVARDPRLVSWRVVDTGIEPDGIAACIGSSASGVLGYLAGYPLDDDYRPDDVCDPYDAGGEEIVMDEAEAEEEEEAVDEIAAMGFCCVGILWDCMDEDDDWCVVGED